jgi:hypothetical protein
VSYPYTESDLFNGEPYHYMYTPFEGYQFLDNYIIDRECRLAELRALAKDDITEIAITEWRGPIKYLQSPMRTTWPFDEDVIDTGIVLQELVLTNVISSGALDNSQFHFINELTRKFEVSKRLRHGYDKNYKATDKSSSAPLEAYAYLAFLICVRSRYQSDLRFHNVLLKLIDLICSANATAMEPIARVALEHSINHELELTRSLLSSANIGGKEKADNA